MASQRGRSWVRVGCVNHEREDVGVSEKGDRRGRQPLQKLDESEFDAFADGVDAVGADLDRVA